MESCRSPNKVETTLLSVVLRQEETVNTLGWDAVGLLRGGFGKLYFVVAPFLTNSRDGGDLTLSVQG